ncbi:DUF3429 domain-containing protein [Vibrio astriarenae]|uniref:DUF3429 domain-containing protein n=1 Tax=Vibrio astriarenae TaxID=1481923 RepID=UPI003736CD26
MRNTLGYMGLIPFIILPVAVLMLDNMSRGMAMYGYFAYSAGIAIFMAGALWGRVVDRDKSNSTVLVMSNLITLFVIALSTVSFHNFTVLTLGLILAHGFNYLFEPRKENAAYIKLRSILTSVVITSHMLMGVLLYIK